MTTCQKEDVHPLTIQVPRWIHKISESQDSSNVLKLDISNSKLVLVAK